MADGEELRSIASVVIGGTNLFGGEGGVIGSLIGALIIGVLGNGLNLLDVSPFWQRIAQGLVIILVVIFDQWRRRRIRQALSRMARSYPRSASISAPAPPRPALYRPDGTLVAEATADVPLRYPAPGVVEQDQEDFYATAAETVGASSRERHRSERGRGDRLRQPDGGDRRGRRGFPSGDALRFLARHALPALHRRAGDATMRDEVTRAHRLSADLRACGQDAVVAARAAGGLRAHREVRDAGRLCCRPSRRPEGGRRLHRPHVPALHRRAATRSAAHGRTTLCDRLGIDPSSCRGSSRRGRSSARRTATARATSACRPACRWSPAPATPRRARSARASSGPACCSTSPAPRPCSPAAPIASSPTSTNRTLLVMRSIVPGLWHPLAYVGGGGLALRLVPRSVRRPGRPTRRLYDALVEEALRRSRPARTGSSSRRISAAASARPTRRGAATGTASPGAMAARISSARSSRASRSSMPPISRSSRASRPASSASRRGSSAAARGAPAGTRSRRTCSACPTGHCRAPTSPPGAARSSRATPSG